MERLEDDFDAGGHHLRATFAENVLAKAKKKHLSINRLADLSGLSRGYLSHVLRRTKAPTLRTVSAVAYALGVEAWELFRPAGKGE